VTLRHAGHGLTDVGNKREHNEDAFLSDDKLGLYAVADGMGGHAAGEVASALAISTVQQLISANVTVLASLARDASHQNKLAAEKLVERAVQEACARIHAAAQADRAKRGMGTTFDCVVVAGNRAIIGHVGDSRIYLLRRGKVHRLTEDHTMMAMALKAGIVKKEDLDESSWASSLTRAVGVQPSVQVDTLLVECQPGDRFLLCSDGLHGYLTDEETPKVLGELPAGVAPRGLISLAKQRGGSDNITAVLVSLMGDLAATLHGTVELDQRMLLLQRIPVFAHMTYKERAAVLSVAANRVFAPGEIIVGEGTKGEDIFIIVSGGVVVEKAGVKIGDLGPGGHFGEMGLVDDAPRSATVRAAVATEAMVISRVDVTTLMRKDQMLAVKLLWSFVQTLSERLRSANVTIITTRSELSKHMAEAPFNPQDGGD
jgi:PPM family protein phosphatase